MIEAQGRSYYYTQQHICTINIDMPFSRLGATQCKSLTNSSRTATHPQHNVPVHQVTALKSSHHTPQKAANCPAKPHLPTML